VSWNIQSTTYFSWENSVVEYTIYSISLHGEIVLWNIYNIFHFFSWENSVIDYITQFSSNNIVPLFFSKTFFKKWNLPLVFMEKYCYREYTSSFFTRKYCYGI
jgi:hypothetical protein